MPSESTLYQSSASTMPCKIMASPSRLEQQAPPGVGEPSSESIGRPAALLDQQQVEFRRVHAPKDVGGQFDGESRAQLPGRRQLLRKEAHIRRAPARYLLPQRFQIGIERGRRLKHLKEWRKPRLDRANRLSVNRELPCCVGLGTDRAYIVAFLGRDRLVAPRYRCLDQQAEERRLVADCGVDGIERDRGALGDPLHRRAGIAALEEEMPRRRDDGFARSLRRSFARTRVI